MRKTNLKQNPDIALVGEWEFYWNQFLNLKTIRDQTGVKQFLNLPGRWENYLLEGHRLPLEGYATFKIRILLPEKNDDIAVKILENSYPLRVYANDKLLAHVGIPGSIPENTTYDSLPQIVKINDSSRELDLVVHISNFHQRKMAGLNVLHFGSYSELLKRREISIIFDFSLIGSLIMIGAYSIILYIFFQTKKDISFLFFGLLCLALSFRSLLMGEYYFNNLFPGVSWETKVRLINYSLFIAIPLLFSYFYNLLKRLFSTNFYFFLMISYLILILIVTFTSSDFFTVTVDIHFVLLITGFTYTLWILIKETIRKRNEMLFILFGFILSFFIIIHDFLTYINVIRSSYKFIIAISLFILFQAVFLSIRFNKLSKRLYQLQKKRFTIPGNSQNSLPEKIPESQLNIFVDKYFLTKREKELIELILQRCTNKEISDKLFISYNTVRRHLNNIYIKIGLNDRNSICEEIKKISPP